MRRRISILTYSLIFPLFLLLLIWKQLVLPVQALFPPQITNKIDPALLEEMETTLPGGQLRFIVYLNDQPDLSHLPETAAIDERRALLVQYLQATAAAVQTPIIKELDTLYQIGHIKSYRPFWIVNGIAAVGDSDAINHLAAQAEVTEIRLDAIVDSIEPMDEGSLRTLIAQPQLANAVQQSWGIERIRAPHVWHGLGVDGTGVTVGIMDSGVDFLHPDLLANYRGNLGNNNFIHAGNWYHTNTPTLTVPFDVLGHGTHVAGTAVGQNGIGVAPGANWIAVSVADEFGFIYTSDAHAGFQWLLAPDGDPALAPDIVNASWGGSPNSAEFLPDVAALHNSGIIPVFAAGNAGPFTGTVGSPASFPNTLAIGATDSLDEVAWFSSRGPSPLTTETKPWLTAPGTSIYSTLPGGQYGLKNGTSMAAPHTAGTIALLLNADPTLSWQATQQILANTAVPLAAIHPNNDSGWGRLDAYTAVQTQIATGQIVGTVQANGAPLPHTRITITTPSGNNLTFFSDDNGAYQADLKAGIYDIQLSLFGYAAYLATNLQVVTNQNKQHDIVLTPLPGGTVQGTVFNSTSSAPISDAVVEVLGTNVTAVTNAQGQYNLTLPQGSYTLNVRHKEYRLSQLTILINNGGNLTKNFWLTSGPSTLLVDSGQWYYQSQANYYEDSLFSLDYSHDTWAIRNPFEDIPTDALLNKYDTVIWSAPFDSPGYIGANNVITNYLGQGGHMLISGQDVGYFDGSGFFVQDWWYRDLDAVFRGETAVTQTIYGAGNTFFDNLSLTLNGGSGANNQSFPDTSSLRQYSLSKEIFHYDNGFAAGLQAGHCRKFRMVYLGFGLEGITEAADRNEMIERSYNYFSSPRQTYGIRFNNEDVDEIVVPGSQQVYTFTVVNTSELLTDTFALTAVNAGWNTSLITETVTLGPCEASQTVLQVNVPANEVKDRFHTTQVTAVSGANPAITTTLLVKHKTPGRILFVDDDRWYDEESHLTAALEGMNLNYDVWEIGWEHLDGHGSPSKELLQEYDIALWYTGYDWYAPITPEEAASLTHFLETGGRLFLTSQDFLYYNHQTELARRYFGIIDYRESVTPTLMYGGNHPGTGPDMAGPLTLNRGVYHNNGDGLMPAPGSQPFFWHNGGMPAGVANKGPTWRSIFWGVPFENLPDDRETAVMNHIVGWLSDLGDSSFAVDARAGTTVSTRTYTITLHNSTLAPTNQVQMVNTLPPELTILPGSVTGNAAYDS
ncbi:MAG: S8 family serine peptidase, partial [Chloroflexi bacterium]|nr:S8 family serine peptidase [Chloroflexota bacterium]